jgi:predicted GH43/DUF377 family glycosyl hydrolase
MLALALLVGPCLALAQTEWIDHQQVVPPPGPGSWDAQRYLSSVIEVNGTYHMYFIGREDPAAEPLYWYWDIGHATSSDGLSWVMDPANPVLTRGAASEWDDHCAAFAAVIHDGTEFRMWYVGNDGEFGRVGYATSPDGSTWTKHSGNPVMDPGAPGAFDDLGVWPGTVLFDGARYRMWYTGAHGTVSSDWDWRIGYAESFDGLNWVRQLLPVLDLGVGWEDTIVYAPSVLFDGARYHMWYTGAGNFASIGYAFSEDGLSWTRHDGNPVLGSGFGHAAVLHDGDAGVFEMWHTNGSGYSFWHATSACCSEVYRSFIPAAAFAAGAHGSFFQTDLDLSNADSVAAEYELWWLPRGENNVEPVVSETFSLGAGMSVRYANALAEVFDLEPDALGALAIVSSSPHLLAMSRTYNLPSEDSAGTFGQSIPAVNSDQLIRPGERRRILFATENAEMRTNIGCQNATGGVVPVKLELFDMEGTSLATETLVLLPWGNDQINRIFADFAPVTGYVEVWTLVTGGAFYCYGSVLDNLTSDPTTIPPM